MLELADSITAGAPACLRAGIGRSSRSDALLRERLPLEFRDQEILALSAEDHYVAVHTVPKGSPLVHFRFADAVRLMYVSDEGVQVHRSWWVGRAGVDTLRRANGKIAMLRLTTGADVPVSKSLSARRSYVKLSAAGSLSSSRAVHA